jgi:lipopolysaccharide transport protein LptA
LTGAARVWDVDSNVTARKINLTETTGDLTAEGDVATRYQQAASAPKQENSGLFTESQPVFATADRMISLQQKGKVEYQGHARLWQGEDRIEADEITIERQSKNLFAEGNVVSYLRAEQGPEKSGEGQKNQASRMVISGRSMRYDDASRRAAYQGGVTFKRALLTIRSEELEGWFSAQGTDSGQRLEKGVARGQVHIAQKNPAGSGVRQGYGQTAIYEPPAERVRLDGVPARVIDEVGNETRGPQLTYRLNDDRLLVQGSSDGRAYTLRRNQP